MNAKDLLNYKNLSILLTGNPDSIRRNKCPKKHRDKVQEFENLIEYLITKSKTTNMNENKQLCGKVVFEPKEDISLFELAKCMAHITQDFNPNANIEYVPEDIRRHFTLNTWYVDLSQ